MKQKKIVKITLLLMIIFSLTGCTKYIKDENKKVIRNIETGQNLPQNILCRPEDKDILKIYNDYNKTTSNKKVNIDKLSKCEHMKIVSSDYDGLWTTFFVQPLAWVIIKIGNLLKSYGFSLIITTLIIRGIMYPFTKKTAMQSENLKKAQPELEKLEKKYKNKTDQQSMMQKNQEMLLIYKKNDINPISGCLFSFIQIPLFFAFYEAISRIPAIFEENFLGFQLGTSPAIALFTNVQLQYIILIILIPVATYFSFKLNSGASMTKEQESQMKMMRNMMVIFMTITAFSISSGIAIYWITSNVFTIFQNLMVKRRIKNG